MRIAVFATLIFTLLSSCKTGKEVNKMEGKTLENGKYEVVSLTEQDSKTELMAKDKAPAFPKKSPYIKINLNSKRMTGSTGFNLFGAAFNPKGNELSIGHVLATRQEGEEVESFERALLKALNQIKTYFFDGEKLRLRDDNGEILIIAKPIKE